MNSQCLNRQEISLYSRHALIFGSDLLYAGVYVSNFYSKLILSLTWTTLMLQRRERGRVMMISSTEIAVSSAALGSCYLGHSLCKPNTDHFASRVKQETLGNKKVNKICNK